MQTQLEIGIEALDRLLENIEEGNDRDLYVDYIIDDVVLKERLTQIKGLLEEYQQTEEKK